MRQYDITDPAQPEADRPGLARRRARQGPSDARPRAGRRAADAAAQPRRQAAVRHQLALQHLGQPVLPEPGKARSCCRSTATPNGGMKINEDFFVDFRESPTGPPGRTRCGSRAATARPTSSSDRRPRHRAAGSRRASCGWRGRRGDRQHLRDRRPDDARPTTATRTSGTTPSRSGTVQ